MRPIVQHALSRLVKCWKVRPVPLHLGTLGVVSLGMRAETLKGHLDLLLLAVIADGALHGYAIIERLRERSGAAFDLPEGTVYPALHRLQRAGYLVSSWTTGTGRRRRVYELTAQGGRALERQRAEWEAFAASVGRVVEGRPWPEPT